ncbi:basic helix-loop-helix ARNT-like protein 1 isoform X2 [Rhodnius prolixus]|uniref:basic helix-loop-helix ARNT-like protein 1 isoform X2 n=1 Tax=Rhodnius prolixus TaxID=13249 RepID=UPI003D189134
MEDTTSRSGEDEAGDEQDDSGHAGPTTMPSSSRQMRNQAEKQRRDKLNQFISELAVLVPMVASSAKKLDKTSILRLSASYLRMHHVAKSTKEVTIKKLSVPINWCHCVLDVMGGILLIVTSSGKIVFISSHVEGLLGYQTNDLLGQSLFTITSPEDRDKLKMNLKPDFDPDLPSTSSEEDILNLEGMKRTRRSFFLKLQHRAISKSDQPQYEDVHIEGHLRIPPGSASNKKQKGEHLTNDNVVLVAVMKPCREKRITAHSILEATKEEWISRHLIDGTIVYSDHRISVVSGYLAHEVSGSPAFLYMHSDDVRWVMIVLRQMYYKGESYGSSCYRLLSKNGEFIYIRTHGYLELSGEDNSFQSFICINSLVSPEEGEKLIAQMKAQFAPIVMQSNEPGTSALADTRAIMDSSPTPNISPLKVDDPNELRTAIEQLLTEVPSSEVQLSPESPVPNQQFAKIAKESKNMPPVTIQSSRIGVMSVPCLKKGPIYNRPSVITPLPRSKDKSKRGVNEEKVSVLKRIRPEETSVIRTVAREDAGLQPPSCQEQVPPSHQSHYSRDFLFSNDYLVTDASVHGGVDESVDIRSLHVELEVPIDPRLWESEVEEKVIRGQIQLENSIQRQERQIFAIENDLTSVPITNTESHIYRSEFTHLRAEHKKQQQMLKTLQQDREQLNVSDI